MKVKAILSAITICFASQASFAAEPSSGCAVISTNSYNLNGKEYPLIYRDPKLKEELPKNSYVTVASGLQEIEAVIEVPESRFRFNPRTIKFAQNENAKFDHNILRFTKQLEPNFKYQFVLARTKNESGETVYEIRTNSKKPYNCDKSKIALGYLTNKEDMYASLPPALQYKMGLLAKEVNEHLKQIGSTKEYVKFQQPKQMPRSIGIITDPSKTQKNGIYVLSTSPYSVASKIGIQSGDTLTKLNDISLTSDATNTTKSIDLLKTAMNGASYQDEFVVEVMRDNKKLELNVPTDELLIPAFSLAIHR